MRDCPLQRASTSRLALAALACCAAAFAQQPDPQPPASRVETIERERAAKAATLAPEALPKTEYFIKRFQDERILERLMEGYKGWRAFGGGLATGNQNAFTGTYTGLRAAPQAEALTIPATMIAGAPRAARARRAPLGLRSATRRPGGT